MVVIQCTARRDKQNSQSKESHTACQYMDPNCSYPPTSHSERREQVHSIAFPAIYLYPIMTVFDSPSAPPLPPLLFLLPLLLAPLCCEPLFMLTTAQNWWRKTANKS